jgi:hypothetical protein
MINSKQGMEEQRAIFLLLEEQEQHAEIDSAYVK